MKKIIILSLFVTSILTLVSCMDIHVKENINIDVFQKEYQGHRYNIFCTRTFSSVDFSVVHDPDCPKCKNEIN